MSQRRTWIPRALLGGFQDKEESKGRQMSGFPKTGPRISKVLTRDELGSRINDNYPLAMIGKNMIFTNNGLFQQKSAVKFILSLRGKMVTFHQDQSDHEKNCGCTADR